jgi:hypothetical protein
LFCHRQHRCAVDVSELPLPVTPVDKYIYDKLINEHGAAAGMLAGRFDAALQSLVREEAVL